MSTVLVTWQFSGSSCFPSVDHSNFECFFGHSTNFVNHLSQAQMVLVIVSACCLPLDC